MSWNVEGLNRNIFNLKHFTEIYHPDLIFLSEPQIFTHDVEHVMGYLKGEYSYSLNTADKYDHELSLVKNRANGGTMVCWKSCLDPYITPLPVSSPSFLPILFQPPSSPLSIHYLPTLGQESQFIEELSKLSNTMEELEDLHPQAPIFLRGDFNVNCKIKTRKNLLEHFSDKHNLLHVMIEHPTYHHFLGGGTSDSFLDKIMFSNHLPHPEVLLSIICKLTNPLIDSHHDMILSTWTLPDEETEEEDSPENVTAPSVPNLRQKVLWTDAGIEAFQETVLPHLTRLQETLLPNPSKSSLSLLLESTTNILISCASLTNKTISLSSPHDPKSSQTPRLVKLSAAKLLKKCKTLRNLSSQHNTSSDTIRSLKIDYN